MALTGTLLADFSSFQAACQQAEVSLRSFETGAGKVEKSLTKMANSLSGTKVISDAQLMTEAVERVGGVSKLTEAELRRVGATVSEAAAKMRAMGIEVPPGMQKIADATKGIGTTATSLIGTLKSVAGAMGIAFSIGTLINFGRSVFDTASQIHDMALQLGISSEAVQGFKFAAEQSGSTLDAVGVAINKMNQNLAGGEKATVQALRDAGLQFQTIRSLKPEEAFLAITDAIKQIPDPMTRADVAMQLFGRGGAELLPAIAAGFREVSDGAEKMSNDTIDSLEAAQDAWERLGNAVVIATGSMIASTINATSEITSSWRSFANFANNVIQFGPAIALTMADLGGAAKQAGKDIELALPPAARKTREELLELAKAEKEAAAEAERMKGIHDRLFGLDLIKRVEDTLTAMGGLNNITKLMPSEFNRLETDALKAAESLRRMGLGATEAALKINGLLASMQALRNVPAEGGLLSIGDVFSGQVGRALDANAELVELVPAMHNEMWKQLASDGDTFAAENEQLINDTYQEWLRQFTTTEAAHGKMTSAMSSQWGTWASNANAAVGSVTSAAQRAFEFLQRSEAAIRSYREAGVFVNPISFASSQYDASIRAQASSFPGFAEGGIATRPTMGIFGEAGPEALVPLDKAGGWGATTINVHVDASGAFFDSPSSLDQLASKVGEALMRQSRWSRRYDSA